MRPIHAAGFFSQLLREWLCIVRACIDYSHNSQKMNYFINDEKS